MARDTEADGSFLCCLPNPFKAFKKKAEQPGPIRQAVENNDTQHCRNRVLIDDQGHPVDGQGMPIQGSIVHQRDEVIPLDVLTPPSSAGGGPATGASGGGTSGAGGRPVSIFGGPSPAGASGGAGRPVSVFAAGARPAGASGRGSSAVSPEGKDGDGGEKNKDTGEGNLAVAANLI